MRPAGALVGVMWAMTGVFLATVVMRGSGLEHPSANPGQVVLLLMSWMSVLVAAAWMRLVVVPAEVTMTRQALGVEAAQARAVTLRESAVYLLGLVPVLSLAAYSMTGWAHGAVALWTTGLVAMVALTPNRAALERVASGSR